MPDDDKKRLKPLSMHPLKTEEALAAFMKVYPKKVRARLKKPKKDDEQEPDK